MPSTEYSLYCCSQSSHRSRRVLGFQFDQPVPGEGNPVEMLSISHLSNAVKPKRWLRMQEECGDSRRGFEAPNFREFKGFEGIAFISSSGSGSRGAFPRRLLSVCWFRWIDILTSWFRFAIVALDWLALRGRWQQSLGTREINHPVEVVPFQNFTAVFQFRQKRFRRILISTNPLRPYQKSFFFLLFFNTF